jgi:hypothetical protein
VLPWVLQKVHILLSYQLEDPLLTEQLRYELKLQIEKKLANNMNDLTMRNLLVD